MIWLLRASDDVYRKAIRNPANHGRLPLAWLTSGYVSGRGWGFVAPWAQQALFPGKGTLAAVGNPRRHHDRFWLLRVRPQRMTVTHPSVDWPITGRYWYGLAWREAFGYRRILGLRIPRVRWVLLDPDQVTRDPGRAEDWGSRAGEDW